MRIGVIGIHTSQNGEILLIQRNDTRTFAPPGGTLDVGELPTEGVAREVREETGLIVLPVRLVSLHYWEFAPYKHLSFVFRCLLRGGDVTPSKESPHVGFYKTQKLPKPMDALSQERIQIATTHSGGPVVIREQKVDTVIKIGTFFLRKIVYPYYDWRRSRRGEAAYIEPTSWEVSVFVVVQNESGDALLCQADGWRLPGGIAKDDVPPWETAVSLTKTQTNHQIQIENLKSVYITKDVAKMTLIFTASTSHADGHWINSNDLPKRIDPRHQTFIKNARLPGDETGFYYLP